MNQIINLVMRIFLRKIVSKGIDKGFDMASGSRGRGGAGRAKTGGHGVSDEDRAEM